MSTIKESEGKIVWKTADQDDFYVLKIENDEDVRAICHEFISSELSNDSTGILSGSVTNEFYSLEDLGTSNGFNLLFLSVLNNCHEDVEKLCKYNFEIDQEFTIEDESLQTKSFSAIDKAWDNFVNAKDTNVKDASNKIIMSLLNVNSKIPKGFESSTASDEVRNFVKAAKILHEFVDTKDMKGIKDGVSRNRHLWYFYDENNQSLMARALKAADLNIFKLLTSLELSIGPHELQNHKQLYKNLQGEDKEAIHDQNRSTSNSLPSAHIYALLSKCKTAKYNRKHHIYQWKIEEAFEIIDSSAGYPTTGSNSKNGRTKVLKIAAACKNIKIFFDFDHDSTKYFNPLTSINRRGSAYLSGVIEIGARDLLDEKTKFQVIGTLIHELSHLAMSMTYVNGFNPYQMGESAEKTRFEVKVRVNCENKKDSEELIRLVFDNYEEHEYDYELIVRPYHMMMKYFNDSNKINDCRCDFVELFVYLEDVVEKEFDEILKICEKLYDDNENIKFSQLTKPMQAKILKEQIYFQGAKTSISRIIKNDAKSSISIINASILNLLQPTKIRTILFSTTDVKFGDELEITSKYDFVERQFKSNVPHRSCLKFKEVKKIVNDSKIFILSCKAGEGKSTVFEIFCKKFKNDYCFKHYWISYLKLKKNQKILDYFFKRYQNLNINKISELICSMILPHTRFQDFKYDSDFEVRIFKKLFQNGKAILFFDGIDEISPELNEFIIEILKTIKELTKNQIWISTRPQFANPIKHALNGNLFTFESYNAPDRKKMIKNIAKKLKFKSHISEILKIFTKEFHNVYNPFLIETITELYEDNKFLISTNIGQMFKNIVYAQYEKMNHIIDSKNRFILDDFKFLYQFLSLKFLFNEDQIRNLSIINNWEREKKNWPFEKIQRYGYVSVDPDFLQTGDTTSIDFIHSLYAEYFASVYVFENVFNKNKSEEEIENIFAILKSIYLIGPSILISLLKNDEENQKLPKKMKILIKNKIEEILIQPASQTINQELKFWSLFIRHEHKVLAELRDKKIQINNADIIDKLQEIGTHMKVLEILQCMFAEWGEDYDQKLKSYLEKLGAKVENSFVDFNLIPTIKWFKSYREKMFLLALARNAKTYLEHIIKKYKNHTSLKTLRKYYGFPSISLFFLCDEKSFKEFVVKNSDENDFFNNVIEEFLSVAKIDRNYKKFKEIIKSLRVNENISKNFVKKLLEEEVFEQIIKHYQPNNKRAIENNKSSNNEHVNNSSRFNFFSLFDMFFNFFLNFQIGHVCTVDKRYTSKKLKNFRRNKKKINWKERRM
ncbi:unnamed protein product [Chironomus riparius]|uniref:NACHT domain-containing protein n=1 Tax=Chironomus riparius TaxID=315576 RepID=A0A9N9WZ08_9DIPT|nr:unnamed protein product [Chironomus riparius]